MDSGQSVVTGMGLVARRATFAGLAASLVGIGLARFAYTPLIPALIDAGWFSAPEAVYLGAANLAGYLAGALLARGMAARVPAARVLQSMMLLASVTFFVSAWPQPFLWYALWRFASG
ncbi:MAG: YbfB/YjiJ family MFS transporter, partial [Kiloniellales bacterium]